MAKARKPKNLDVEFSVKNMLTMDFESETFDVIFSRDVLVYATKEEKIELFDKIYKWLKPGGRLLLVDFTSLKDPFEQSQEFKAYTKNRSYTLSSLQEYSG